MGSPTLRLTFDPNPSTAIIGGTRFAPYGAAFGSPEHSRPDDIWILGDPVTLDGRVGGVAPACGAPTGKLEIRPVFVICLGVDVRTGSPDTAELFDRLDARSSSVTGSSPPFELPFFGDTWTGYRVALTPGTLPGPVRDELTVDNLRATKYVVPVRASTWGAIKTIYR